MPHVALFSLYEAPLPLIILIKYNQKTNLTGIPRSILTKYCNHSRKLNVRNNNKELKRKIAAMSFKRTLLAATILTIVLAGFVWILNIQGIIKGSWSNPISALFTILAVLFAFIQIVPQFSSATNTKPKTSLTPISLSSKPKSSLQSELFTSTFQNKAEDFSLLRTFQGHSGRVNSVAISPDGHILVSKGFDKTVKVWNLHTGQLLHIPEKYARVSSELIINSDAESFATCTRDGIKVFNLSAGELLRTVALPSSTIFMRSITISPDGHILTATTDDNTIMIWNLTTGELLHTLDGYSTRAYNVVISPDGQTLANGNEDGTINVWNWRNGKLLYTLKGFSPIGYHINDHPDGRNISQYEIAFSPDGQSLISVNSDRTITVWNQHTGQLLYTLKCHATIVSRIIFSSDGRTIASGNEDGIKVWNLYTGELLRILRKYSSPIKSIAIGSNGNTLAIGNNDGTITVWR
jgi:WD40 repeat protein